MAAAAVGVEVEQLLQLYGRFAYRFPLEVFPFFLVFRWRELQAAEKAWLFNQHFCP